MDEGWAVITAAFIAIGGIAYSGRQQRKALRKQHTYGVLDKLNDWQKFDENYDFARSLMKAGEVPSAHRPADADACERIEFLLNHYEFLSACIVSGDVDETLVRRVEEGRLTRVFLKFMPYIKEIRTDLDAEGVWENVEFICHRWAVERPDSLDRAVTRFMLKPQKAQFDGTREIVWGELLKRAEVEP